MIKCVVFGCWNMAPNKSGLCVDHRPAIADQSPKGRDAKRLDAKHASGGPEGNRHD